MHIARFIEVSSTNQWFLLWWSANVLLGQQIQVVNDAQETTALGANVNWG